MGFSDQIKRQVWEKAKIDPNFDSSQKRRDKCGAVIAKASYGMQTRYGWEIDHIIPDSKGGSNLLSNLQPLHWENNASKGDGLDRPSVYCEITD